MTDLPADPSAWDAFDEEPIDAIDVADDETDDESAVVGAGSRRAEGAMPVHRVTARPVDPARAERLPVPVVYDSLDSFSPKVSWKALAGPLAGVVVVSIGLGLLMARGNRGDSRPAAASTTVVAVAGTTAPTVLGTSVAPSTAAATTAPATTAPATTAPATTAPATTSPAASTAGTAAVPTTATPPTTPAPASSVPAGGTVAPLVQGSASIAGVDVQHPVRWAEFTRGKVYLHGRVPTAALAQTLIDKVAAVVGKDNVVVDYVVDPTTPAVAGGPLTVTDTVLFDSESSVLRPEFRSILDLGVLLMRQNPAVRITVVGRADGRGGASYNQQLSRARADAVVAYLTNKGADAGRLTVDARGADDPLATGDDAAALAANRSVEFVILGLVD